MRVVRCKRALGASPSAPDGSRGRGLACNTGVRRLRRGRAECRGQSDARVGQPPLSFKTDPRTSRARRERPGWPRRATVGPSGALPALGGARLRAEGRRELPLTDLLNWAVACSEGAVGGSGMSRCVTMTLAALRAGSGPLTLRRRWKLHNKRDDKACWTCSGAWTWPWRPCRATRSGLPTSSWRRIRGEPALDACLTMQANDSAADGADPRRGTVPRSETPSPRAASSSSS